MGNCCRPGKSSMVWAGDDDWDNLSSPVAEEPNKSRFRGGGKLALSLDRNTLAASSSPSSSSSNDNPDAIREVKIKITKKELQELLENANVHGVAVEHVLSRLINENGGSHHHHVVEMLHHHHQPWKPTLKSIPE